MNPSSAPLPSHWRIFTAAPHRVMFFGGALQAVAALLRILADILPAESRIWLYPAAAVGWLACFLPWSLAYLPALLRSRADGRPG